MCIGLLGDVESLIDVGLSSSVHFQQVLNDRTSMITELRSLMGQVIILALLADIAHGHEDATSSSNKNENSLDLD